MRNISYRLWACPVVADSYRCILLGYGLSWQLAVILGFLLGRWAANLETLGIELGMNGCFDFKGAGGNVQVVVWVDSYWTLRDRSQIVDNTGQRTKQGWLLRSDC